MRRMTSCGMRTRARAACSHNRCISELRAMQTIRNKAASVLGAQDRQAKSARPSGTQARFIFHMISHRVPDAFRAVTALSCLCAEVVKQYRSAPTNCTSTSSVYYDSFLWQGIKAPGLWNLMLWCAIFRASTQGSSCADHYTSPCMVSVR